MGKIKTDGTDECWMNGLLQWKYGYGKQGRRRKNELGIRGTGRDDKRGRNERGMEVERYWLLVKFECFNFLYLYFTCF